MTVLLTACTQPASVSPGATPERAFLYQDGINVIMSQGSLCIGERPGRALEWTGRLSGCPYLFGYSVRLSQQPTRPRTILSKNGDLTNSVTVTDAKGDPHVFSAH